MRGTWHYVSGLVVVILAVEWLPPTITRSWRAFVVGAAIGFAYEIVFLVLEERLTSRRRRRLTKTIVADNEAWLELLRKRAAPGGPRHMHGLDECDETCDPNVGMNFNQLLEDARAIRRVSEHLEPCFSFTYPDGEPIGDVIDWKRITEKRVGSDHLTTNCSTWADDYVGTEARAYTEPDPED